MAARVARGVCSWCRNCYPTHTNTPAPGEWSPLPPHLVACRSPPDDLTLMHPLTLSHCRPSLSFSAPKDPNVGNCSVAPPEIHGFRFVQVWEGCEGLINTSLLRIKTVGVRRLSLGPLVVGVRMKQHPHPMQCNETSHLTSRHLYSLTSPHLTSPHLTSPHLTSPHLA